MIVRSRVLSAMAPLGLFWFWAGLYAAARRYPSEYDWRYMTISSLLYPDRDPGGYAWAWCGIVLCALGGLCWVAVLHSRSRSTGVWALGFGYLCMVGCALWPGRLLRLPRGHDVLALLAFVAICVGMVQLTYLAVAKGLRRYTPEREIRVRVVAGIIAGAALLPLVLVGMTQADVAHAFPNLPWVGLEWRARGVPVYLSFALWEWAACAVFSAYIFSLSVVTSFDRHYPI